MSNGAEEEGVHALTTLDSNDPAPVPWLAKGRRVLLWGEQGQWRAVLVIVGMVALPFLLLFVGGRERAGITKLTAGPATPTAGPATTDELLGGLLAQGVDHRGSCRSRFEASRYYRHFPYVPSAYLLQKLRAYEARHRRCGPGTPRYAEAADRLRSGTGNSSNDDECRYVVWLPFDGLGNRMLSMLSGFLYALLTDRVLLIALPEDSSDLFCEPFLGATWRVPPDFPVANLFGLGEHPPQAYTNLLKSQAIVLNRTATTKTPPPPSYVFLSIGYDRGIMDAPFFCGEHQKVLGNVTWIMQHSDLYYVPSLYAVPAFRAEMRRMFPESLQSMGHLLGRYLFHPTDPVWGLVTRFHRSYLAHANHRIGVQVRMFGFVSIPPEDMYKQILACSKQEHILPDIVSNTGTAAGAGNDHLVTRNNGTTSTAILVASLYADYYERLKARYYEHAAAAGGGAVSVFQPTHEERQDTSRLAHNQRALAEIYLLAFSDELITTAISTFGYVSASLAGVRPAILLPAYGHKVPETPCVRAVSMEPCNLTPPVVECQPTGEEADVGRHVRVCEDREQGVKLFD